MSAHEQRLHVAMIIIEYLPLVGGAQRQIQQLAPHLQAAGLEVSVLTRHIGPTPRREKLDGVQVIRVPISGGRLWTSLSYTWGCLTWLRRYRPDIIHSYSFLSPLTIGILANIFWRTPLIVKVLRGGRLGDPQRLRRRTLYRQRLAVYKRYVDRFIEISGEIHRELGALGIPEAKRLQIPNGVATDRFAPAVDKAKVRASLGLSDEAILAVYTGRIAAEKRLDLLLDIWPHLTPSAQLIILGDGPEQARLAAREVANVQFLGRQTDILPYLQASDIFVLPSDTEGLSNSLLEAMSVGLAVVATAVGGALDVIEPEVSGFLVAANRPDLLANRLQTLIENPGLRGQLGRQARQQMQQSYDLKVVAARYVALYRSLAEGSPPEPF